MHKFKTLVFLFGILMSGRAVGQQLIWNHDYAKTLVMKLDLAIPDGEGGTKVFCDMETAFELIKKADELTLQVPKIIYLVGWQYNGHDDKYPAFFEVNKALKREQDQDATESLRWLMREARKYHTVVSLHINMTDAYDDSPLWETYVENDLISKTLSGELMVIGNYNNKKAYQINYKREWQAGWTQRRIDRLLDLLPELKEAGTIHIDAWIARESKGHHESMITEAEYQKKALYYWTARGIDVTSEWAMDYMTGLVPYAWHFNHRTQSQYLEIPASMYTGSGINPDIEWSDFGLGFLFGKSMYGEPLWPYFHKTIEEKENWTHAFAKDFYLNCLQYFFLNQYERISVEGTDDQRVAIFTDDVTVSLADSTVTQAGIRLRVGNMVVFPVAWKNNQMLAIYSDSDQSKGVIELPGLWKYVGALDLYEVTTEGLRDVGRVKVADGKVRLSLTGGQPYVLRTGGAGQ